MTRELLTGEGAFSGTKITVEILNTMFLLSREVLRNYIEKQLFIPICEAHNWFEEDKNGAKKYWYPQIGFNRLTIRDNAEVFDSLFQLYSKGSLPVEVIYELFNLNSDEMHSKLLAGLFTVKDSTFNRASEEVNVEVGRALVQQTDVVQRVSKYLGLEFKGPPDGGGEGGGEPGAEGGGEPGGESGGEGGFQEGYGEAPSTDGATVTENSTGEQVTEGNGDVKDEETEPAKEDKKPDLDDLSQELVDALPPNATEQDIAEAVEEADKAHGEKE